MKKKICFVTRRKFSSREYSRFGFKTINKDFEIFIIDISNFFYKISINSPKKLKIKNVHEFNNLKNLIFFLKKNTFSFCIDNLNNSFYEIIIRIILKLKGIKCIKYTGSPKPLIFFDYVYGKQKFFFKLKEILRKIPSFLSKRFLKILNSYLIDIVIISGKNLHDKEIFLHKKIKKIYSHGFDYNYFLKLRKKKIKNKNYILFLDEDFISHQNIIIEKRKPVVGRNFYSKLEKFLINISKENKCDFKIALHPKSVLREKNFKITNKCYINQTPELIQKSKYVICCSSVSVSFAVLFKKPIISLTSKELDDARNGARIRSISKLLGTQLFILEKKYRSLKIKSKINDDKYKNYINQYIKHPKSNDTDTWKTLSKNLRKQN